MKRSLKVAALAAGIVVAGAPSAADAAWQTVGTGSMNISDQVSLARTSDGVLHVGWYRQGYDLLQTPVTASGAVGSPVPIVSGWSQVGNPVLLAQGGALTAVWGGTPTLVTQNPQAGIDLATSADGGATWAVGAAAISTNGMSSSPAAAFSGSTLLVGYLSGLETVVHSGVDPAVPAAGGYPQAIDQQLATSASGEAMLAWCSSGRGGGVGVAPVTPTSGAAGGPVATMPGTGFCDAAARVALVARVGGGFYVAAPSAARSKVLVWRTGTAAPATIAGGSSTKQQVAMAATPDGRLWAGWEDSDTGKAVFTRSNKTATKWGAAVAVRLPAGGRIFQLNLDAQLDRADAVVRNQADDGTVSLLTEQIRPGLTLVATGGQQQTFRVLDAGDPVAGASVRVGGRTLTTNGTGRVGTDLKPGRYTAVASKSGYVGAAARVRAR
jgi:hypothetical protein